MLHNYHGFWAITVISENGKVLVKNRGIKPEYGDYERDAVIRFYKKCSQKELKTFSENDIVYVSRVTPVKHLMEFLIPNVVEIIKEEKNLISKKKPLSKITAADVPLGLDTEDVASEE